MEIQGGLTVSKPAAFGQRASVTGTRVGQKLSHLTTRRVIIGNGCSGMPCSNGTYVCAYGNVQHMYNVHASTHAGNTMYAAQYCMDL